MTTTVAPHKTSQPATIGSLYYLINFLCAGAYMPFLFVYLSELGLSGKQLGLLSSLSPIVTLLLATPVSSFADRRHLRVRAAQVALVGVGVSLFLLGFPTQFSGVAGLMLLMAIFSSPIMSLTDSLISRMAQRRSLNYGGMRLWGSLGYALSAMFFGAVWQRLGFRPMFVAAALFYIPLVWIAGYLEEGPQVDVKARLPVWSLFQHAGFVFLLVATFLSGIANSLAMTYSGIYARSLGGGNFLVGLMIAVGAFAELPAMFYSGRLAQRLKKPHTIILAYAFMVAAYLGFIYSPDANWLPVFSILKGIGYGLWFTLTVRLVTELTPAAWASTAQSFLSVGMFGAAMLVAGPLGGLLIDAVGTAAVFWLANASLVAAGLTLWVAIVLKKLT